MSWLCNHYFNISEDLSRRREIKAIIFKVLSVVFRGIIHEEPFQMKISRFPELKLKNHWTEYPL